MIKVATKIAIMVFTCVLRVREVLICTTLSVSLEQCRTGYAECSCCVLFFKNKKKSRIERQVWARRYKNKRAFG